MSLNYQYARAYADVLPSGLWQKRAQDDITQTIKWEGAHIFADRWQGGFSLPYQFRKRDTESSGSKRAEGVGDASFQIGYEYLPDWTYHPYRPKGIIFLSVTTPTGRSVYETKETTAIDVTGKGFWSVGLGAIHIKSWNQWDVSLMMEGHHGRPRQFHTQILEGEARPGNGGSINFGAGYSWRAFRLGAAAAWYYEDPVHTKTASSTTTTNGSLQRYASSTIAISYLLQNNNSLSLSYTDQTLLGSPANATLSKSISLFYQWRWQR